MEAGLIDLEWLNSASVADGVFRLRPDYRALLVLAEGLVPGSSDALSDQLLSDAELKIARKLDGRRPEELEELAAWREAYRAFGAKPQRTRPSVEALVRRVDAGLPRIDRITDTYNAISVAHLLPLGGEDADKYVGPPQLARATGEEEFETFAEGQPVIESPKTGEVVWKDDAGVTCRRWNWRQSTRTHIGDRTVRALFILDGLLDVTAASELMTAGEELQAALARFSPQARFASRLLAP
ncbi:B3/B4 domain-containing protein [Saccharopolyspora pogona]|uniref:B3/B4 domain-containing protein n=1 Tax=Saccharopolyspora pogona TaxID=333966 RepID=UPI0016887451|nr:phenylalanine--tRNA ligase beta subunit-related protein [Saccharopolyspora pogona]